MSQETFSPLAWRDGRLHLLEQTLLPREEVWIACERPEEVADAIRRLAVRGAPAIGVAAAYGLALGMKDTGHLPADEAREHFDEVAELLGSTRPTAVNLSWAIERGRRVVEGHLTAGADGDAAGLPAALLDWAQELHARDVATNRRIGEHGAELFAAGDRVLTHCNAGALATAGYGTAIGVIESAWRSERLAQVWVDETRPLLQGARLTAWELRRLGVPHRLVTDSSVGSLMTRGLVDRIVVGADRIAANGDTANKVGTYVVAVLAQRHGVPFYVAAPLSTVDRATATGADIPIEERAAGEVTEVFGIRVAPDDTEAANPAFDVTPAELVTAIITEEGVIHPPYDENLAAAFDRAGNP
jgi:methylthioribose-1-phosphate isomerase